MLRCHSGNRGSLGVSLPDVRPLGKYCNCESEWLNEGTVLSQTTQGNYFYTVSPRCLHISNISDDTLSHCLLSGQFILLAIPSTFIHSNLFFYFTEFPINLNVFGDHLSFLYRHYAPVRSAKVKSLYQTPFLILFMAWFFSAITIHCTCILWLPFGRVVFIVTGAVGTHPQRIHRKQCIHILDIMPKVTEDEFADYIIITMITM